MRAWRWLWPATAMVLVACGPPASPPASPPAPGSAPTQDASVVPWADLAPTHPQLPTRWTPPQPDPAAAEAAAPCRADQLASGRPTRDGAGGTLYFEYELALVAGRPCRVEGVPALQPLDDGRPVDVPVEPQRRLVDYPHPALVGGPSPVRLWLAWPQDWCAPPLPVDVLRMSLPGGHLDLAGPDASPFCDGGDGPRPIEVSAFYPEDHRPGTTVSDYDRIRVDGDLDLRGSPGEPVDFTVRLASREDLVLDPCPDYTIEMYGDATAEEVSYALNCSAVPFTDDHGRPMLPAGHPVVVAMRVTAPDADVTKLVWSLDTPHPSPVGGSVRVGDHRH